MPYRQVHQYISTETAYYDDDGNEVERFENPDGYWYDSEPREFITQEELEEEVG